MSKGIAKRHDGHQNGAEDEIPIIELRQINRDDEKDCQDGRVIAIGQMLSPQPKKPPNGKDAKY